MSFLDSKLVLSVFFVLAESWFPVSCLAFHLALSVSKIRCLITLCGLYSRKPLIEMV